MNQHSKSYDTPDEFHFRYGVWKSNFNYIYQHNLNHTRTHTLGMNPFGDLTNEEFVARFNGYVPRSRDFLRSKNTAKLNVGSLPSSVDWRTKGAVTAVKNQGQCGSCWSFSTTGAVEGIHAIKTGTLVSLSEQQLMDCSTAEGNQGCNGGEMDDAFEYIIKNGGICSESSYPYEGYDDTCRSSSCQSVASIKGYTDVTVNDPSALEAAVAQQPVSIAVDAAGMDWQFYSGGVLSDSCGTSLDHGVLAVGYGSDSGQDYWIVKNSWGSDWGESGYIRLLRSSASGPGECGIQMDASYPTM
jgi:C1A family cysteine protease